MYKNKVWVGILLLFFLTGCGMDQDVWVYADDSWKIKQVFEYNPSLIPDLSFGSEGVGIKIPVGGWTDEFIKLAYNQLIQVYQQNGVEASLKRTRTLDGVSYLINLSGNGLPLLQNIGLAGDMSSLLSPIASMYQINLAELQQMPEIQQIQQMRNVTLDRVDENTLRLVIQQTQPAFGLTFKLHAKSILSANAASVTGGVAEWKDPMVIDVTFQPLPLFNPAPIIIGGGILAGLGLTVGAVALATRTARNGRTRQVGTSRSQVSVDRLRRQQEQRRSALRRTGRR